MRPYLEDEIPIPDSTWDPNGEYFFDPDYDGPGEPIIVEGWFLCPHCGAWCDVELGCADEMFEACDPCWNERLERKGNHETA